MSKYSSVLVFMVYVANVTNTHGSCADQKLRESIVHFVNFSINNYRHESCLAIVDNSQLSIKCYSINPTSSLPDPEYEHKKMD